MNTGIDLGLKETAIITLDNSGKIIYQTNFGTNTNTQFSNDNHPMIRYKTYYDYFIDYFKDFNICGTIIMENPMGSFVGNGIKLAELKGVYLIGLSVYFLANKVFLPNAVQIKKFFTGLGNATKKQMIDKSRELGYIIKNDHEADALAMAWMGYKNCSLLKR